MEPDLMQHGDGADHRVAAGFALDLPVGLDTERLGPITSIPRVDVRQ